MRSRGGGHTYRDTYVDMRLSVFAVLASMRRRFMFVLCIS
jgi:hypothetical protein